MSVSTLRSIGFPFRKGLNGFPNTVTGNRVVIEDVFSMLKTARFEIPMGNQLGVNVYRFVMETSGALLSARIAQDIRSVIRLKEPRMIVLGVTSEEKVTGSGTVMEVAIEYEIGGEEGTFAVPVGGVS